MSGDVNEELTKEIIRVAGRESDEAAAAMFINGAPASVIAQELGYPSESAVSSAITRALAGSLSDFDRKELKRLFTERYEKLWRNVQKRATDPSYPQAEKAMANALKLLKDQTQFLGIADPKQLNVVHSADRESISRWVQEVAAARIESFPQERDIIDVEVIHEAPGRDGLAGEDSANPVGAGEDEAADRGSEGT